MKCICCDYEILPYPLPDEIAIPQEEIVFSDIKDHRAENAMWSDGIVGNISAGFGSNQDGSMFVIGICDKCSREKVEDGTIAYIGDYMFGKGGINKIIQDERNSKYRKIWRRRNNLDHLSS